MAFFQIEMESPEGMFFAQCFQSGEQLNSYRLDNNNDNKFLPSDFNLTLIDMEKDTVVKSKISYGEFSPSLVIGKSVLKARKYMLVVDVMWNKLA